MEVVIYYKLLVKEGRSSATWCSLTNCHLITKGAIKSVRDTHCSLIKPPTWVRQSAGFKSRRISKLTC